MRRAVRLAQEIDARRRALLEAGQQRQQVLGPLRVDAPGSQHRLPRLAQVQPLGHAVEEEVDDVEFAQIALREGLVLVPEPFAHGARRRPREHAAPGRVGEGRLDVAHRQPPGVHLHRQPGKCSSLRPASAERTSLAQPGRPRTCGASNSMAPSALSRRPRRTPLRIARGSSPAPVWPCS
jgi:hypothetical protein